MRPGAGIFEEDDATVWMVGVACAAETPNPAPVRMIAPAAARETVVLVILRMVSFLFCVALGAAAVRAEHTLVEGGEPAISGW
ncbi:hypothetical protein [Curtobacterium sp. SL109]|uniref:hypothetical protein n=1 Tax=Curtobacterium sp. SL109 TaxID=2994662 RepID=UPI002274531D|nr:hypothetical protein [Curtobacterium sp. SL109]MCY1692999.1 hypothetical protein [Curtobacterium sp. SL109]